MPKKYEKSKEELLEDFASRFMELRPCSNRKYDKMRNKGAPTWESLAKMCGVEKWNELLKLAGLGKYRKACKDQMRFNVRIFDDF